MNEKNDEKINKSAILSCNELLEDFFSNVLCSQKDIDKLIVKSLGDLYKQDQLTADNIIKALREERIKLL